MTLNQWAARWNLPPEALAELSSVMLAAAPKENPLRSKAKSEGDIMALAKLNASAAGWRLFRNNVGALKDKDGRHVRYGLANESKRLNASLKSSDLIGIRPIVIDPTWLGATVGQFVAIECKAPGWKWRGTERELAQANFHKMVVGLGGHACFTCTGDIE